MSFLLGNCIVLIVYGFTVRVKNLSLYLDKKWEMLWDICVLCEGIVL